jgi:hypothetical protein
MPGHLIFSELLGAQEMGGAIPGPGLVACALAPDGRVVYGKSTDAALVKKTRPPSAVRLAPYTAEIKQQRRSLAETVLGYRALNSSELLQGVLDKVSNGILAYWRKRIDQLQKEAAPFMVDASKKYLYGATSFGRLPAPAPKAQWVTSIESWMHALSATPRDVPKIMNIQDNFLRIFKSLGPCDLDNRWIRPMPEDLRAQLNKGTPTTPEDKTKRDNTLKKIMPDAWEWRKSPTWASMEAIGQRVRPLWLFDPKFRGRTDRGEPVKTNKPGILVDGPGVPDINITATLGRLNLNLGQLQSTEERARGVDGMCPILNPCPLYLRSR